MPFTIDNDAGSTRPPASLPQRMMSKLEVFVMRMSLSFRSWLYPNDQIAAPGARIKLAWSFLAVFGIAALVASIALHRSLEVGRLSGPMWYDDVVYLFNAQSMLHDAPHQPVQTTIWQLLGEHALIPVLLGCLGFLLVPADSTSAGLIGPYICNTLLLLGFLVGCISQLRKMPTAAIVGIVCAVGATPLASLTITEFRPDFAWGQITALAALAAVSTNVFTCSRRKVVIIGLLAGLALIGKPSAVPVTFVMLVLAFGGAIWIHWRESGAVRRPRLYSLALLIGSIAVVATPVYWVSGAEIYNYIITALVTIKDQNTIQGDILFQWSYYSFGPGGATVIGSALPVCLVVWLGGLLFAAVYSRPLLRRFLVLFVVLAASYAAPSQTAVKTVFLGAGFYALLILSAVYVGARVGELAMDKWPQSRLWPVMAGMTFLVGGGTLIYANLIDHPTGLMEAAPDRRQDLADGTARIWSVLKENTLAAQQAHKQTGISRVMVLTPEPITAGWISLYSVIENVPLRGVGLYYARSLEDLHVELKRVDYVVAGNSIKYQLYGPRLGDDFMAEMNARDDFHLIGSYSRITGEIVNIYERVR